MLPLRLHPQPFTLTKLAADAPLPTHLPTPHFLARTAAELSIIAPSDDGAPSGQHFRLLEIALTFGTTESGILVQLLAPLAQAQVWVLALGTHDTDYLLLRADQTPAAVTALQRAGHRLI